MVLFSFILLALLLIIGFLIVPIQIYINTDQVAYFVRLKGLMKAALEPDEKEVLRLRLKVLFFERMYYPLTKFGQKRKKKTKQKKNGRKGGFGPRKTINLLRTFEVRELCLDMDTGDYVTNAKMYPVMGFLNQYVGSFHINFQDKNRLVVDIRNRPYRIIKSIINT